MGMDPQSSHHAASESADMVRGRSGGRRSTFQTPGQGVADQQGDSCRRSRWPPVQASGGISSSAPARRRLARANIFAAPSGYVDQRNVDNRRQVRQAATGPIVEPEAVTDRPVRGHPGASPGRSLCKAPTRGRAREWRAVDVGARQAGGPEGIGCRSTGNHDEAASAAAGRHGEGSRETTSSPGSAGQSCTSRRLPGVVEPFDGVITQATSTSAPCGRPTRPPAPMFTIMKGNVIRTQSSCPQTSLWPEPGQGFGVVHVPGCPIAASGHGDA